FGFGYTAKPANPKFSVASVTDVSVEHIVIDQLFKVPLFGTVTSAIAILHAPAESIPSNTSSVFNGLYEFPAPIPEHTKFAASSSNVVIRFGPKNVPHPCWYTTLSTTVLPGFTSPM